MGNLDPATEQQYLSSLNQIENSIDVMRTGYIHASDMAIKYTDTATARKPSLVGIILVFLAIGLETLPIRAAMYSTPDFNRILFFSGLIFLFIGVALETAVDLFRQKQLADEKRQMLHALSRAEEQSKTLFDRLKGK